MAMLVELAGEGGEVKSGGMREEDKGGRVVLGQCYF